MRIGLNGQNILRENPAGPEKYTLNLYNSLAKTDKTNNYILYLETTPPEEFWGNLTDNNSNFSYKIIDSKGSWTQVGLAIELLKQPVDIFFSPIHTLPIINSAFRLPRVTKYIAMIHGLEYKYLPGEKHLFSFLRGSHEWFVSSFTDLVIVPTHVVKDEIVKKNWKKENLIKVVNEGVAESFYKRSAEEIKLVKEKYQIGDCKYFIFVSTIQPRKNIPNMVQGFSKFISESPIYKDMRLLIVGKNGWDYEESLQAPKRYNIEDNVKFLGRAPDEDLPALLSGSEALVNLSLKEGFGLPLLEGMACQTKCLVSDIEAHKEIAKDVPIYVSPLDINEISQGMKKILESDMQENIKKGLEIARSFGWDKTAEKTLDIFKSL